MGFFDGVDLYHLLSMMDASDRKEYQLPEGFVEVLKDPLTHLNLKDSTELWIIQWPKNQTPDFNGQHASLNLKTDGHLGTLEDSEGKSYDLVSSKCEDAEAIVFLPTASEVKIAGKITRQVSLIRYPEPSELKKCSYLHLSQPQRSSVKTSTFSGRRTATPTRTINPHRTSTHLTPSSISKSLKSGSQELPKPSKRKRVDQSKSLGVLSREKEAMPSPQRAL